MADPTDPLVLQVTITLDRHAVIELAATLVPFVAQQVRSEMLTAFRDMERTHPPVLEMQYPSPPR